MKKFILTLILGPLFFLFVSGQVFAAEKLSSQQIIEMLSGRTIVTASQSRKNNYQKYINNDGTFFGVKNNGELWAKGFWWVNESNQFCQVDSGAKSNVKCIDVGKEGDTFIGYSDNVYQNQSSDWRVSSWRVVEDTPQVITYMDQLAKEQKAIAIAYEKQTGINYETALAASREKMITDYTIMIAEQKRRALEAMPAAGTESIDK